MLVEFTNSGSMSSCLDSDGVGDADLGDEGPASAFGLILSGMSEVEADMVVRMRALWMGSLSVLASLVAMQGC